MRYILVDIIRIFAISLILLSHINSTLDGILSNVIGVPGLYYVSLGGASVTIFLILSGLVLTLSEKEDTNYFLFIKKRLFRIYSIYFLCLPIGIILYWIKTGDVSIHFSVKDTILTLTGFYAFAGEWGGPFIKTSWYIGLIVALYFLFPLLLRLMRKFSNITILALLIISVGCRLYLGHNEVLPSRPLDWFPLCRVFEFGLGMYVALKINPINFNIININPRYTPVIYYLSALSFPLFLIHHPFLFLLRNREIPTAVAVLMVLSLSFLISAILLHIDTRLHANLNKRL